MLVKYTVLLKDESGQEYLHNDKVSIDSEKGLFGDKDYNKKAFDAIYEKHPDCKIIDLTSSRNTE